MHRMEPPLISLAPKSIRSNHASHGAFTDFLTFRYLRQRGAFHAQVGAPRYPAPLLSLTGRAAVSTCLSREAVESAAKPDSRSPAPLDLHPCEWGSRCGKVFVDDARVSCDLRRSPARRELDTRGRSPACPYFCWHQKIALLTRWIFHFVIVHALPIIPEVL